MKDNLSLEHKIRLVHEAAMARNSQIRMRDVETVDRNTFNKRDKKDVDKNVKDPKSELAKLGEIKTKIIDEDAVAGVSTKDTPKEQPDSGKQKKSNQKNLVEPGTIMGGKTEVELEPSTDERDDNGKKIKDDSKKSTKAANAQAGVKEETMIKTNFGLPADLIKTVAEAMGKCTKCGKKPCMCESIDERDMGNKTKKDAAVASVGAKNRDEKHLGSRGMKTSVADKIRGREKMSGKDRMEEEIDPGFSAAELAHIESIINEDSKDPYTSKSGKHLDDHMHEYDPDEHGDSPDEHDQEPDHHIDLHNDNDDHVTVHYKKKDGKTTHTFMTHGGGHQNAGVFVVKGKAHPKHIETSWRRAMKTDHEGQDSGW